MRKKLEAFFAGKGKKKPRPPDIRTGALSFKRGEGSRKEQVINA